MKMLSQINELIYVPNGGAVIFRCDTDTMQQDEALREIFEYLDDHGVAAVAVDYTQFGVEVGTVGTDLSR